LEREDLECPTCEVKSNIVVFLMPVSHVVLHLAIYMYCWGRFRCQWEWIQFPYCMSDIVMQQNWWFFLWPRLNNSSWNSWSSCSFGSYTEVLLIGRITSTSCCTGITSGTAWSWCLAPSLFLKLSTSSKSTSDPPKPEIIGKSSLGR